MTGQLEPPAAPADDPSLAAPSFDLSKKKKKKKPKPTSDPSAADEAPATESPPGPSDPNDPNDPNDPASATASDDAPLDFALPEFGVKKKKKKKKVVFTDDFADDSAPTDEANAPDRSTRREFPSQPWDGSDRDYSYAELVNRAFQFLHGKNPALASGASQRKRVTLQLPQVAREGTKKTVFLNFGSICKSIHRQQDHLLAYMGAELGTTGNITEGGRLVIKGRFGSEGIANVLKRYMLEYVVCTSCRSPDTVLMRDANTRLYFVSCESCGAKRSVAPIRQGFMARVEKRKKK